MKRKDEQRAIFAVLRQLLTDGENRTGRRTSATMTVSNTAQRQFTPLNERELSWMGSIPRHKFPPEKVIYIDPPSTEKSAVAALWCRWDFDVRLSRCGFYFGIWSAQPAFPNLDADDKHPAFTAFRYETPEVGGNHDYFHAQPCRSMGDTDVVYALPISPRFPTFPLVAQSSLELLLCLMTSVYGMDGLKELQSKVSGIPSMRRNTLLRNSIQRILELKQRAGDES